MRLFLLPFLSLLACAGAKTVDGPCEPKGMAFLREALQAAEPGDQPDLALGGLGEVCAAKLPRPIVEVMSPNMDPAFEGTACYNAFTQEVGFGEAACPDFMKRYESLSTEGREQGAKSMYEHCGYTKLGVVSLAEYEAASKKRLCSTLLAHPLYTSLVAEGMQPQEARALIRAMLGTEPYARR